MSSSSSELKLIQKPRNNANNNMKPFLLLKDYLKDDFSSCSSNGFKSFPRKQQHQQQQCCTSVRFLLDLDLQHSDNFNNKKNSSSKQFLTRSRSISVLQRASGVLLNVVKLLPFSTRCSSGTNNNSKGFLTKSFSRKLLKTRFWKKSDDEEVQRLRSFNEKEFPMIDTITVDTTTTATTARTSTSGGTMSCDSTSNSWSGSEFTSAECLQVSPGRNSDSSSGCNVGCASQVPENKCWTKVGAESKVDATVTSYSVEPNAKKAWPTEEEKEQFSPVSVLDCPFDDQEEDEAEEEEICLPFRHRLAQLEGKTKKLKKKLRHFENLTELLEPVELEKRIALSEPVTIDQLVDTTTSMFIDIEQEVKIEEKAEDSLNIMKTRVPSKSLFKLKSNKLFIDLFKEGMEKSWDEVDVMKTAEDWANGKPNEVLLDWKVKEGRKAYIQDMEERGEWRSREDDDEMTQHVGVDIEFGVWSNLIDELVSDICT